MVIGSDSVVVLGDQLLEKPKSHEDAFNMIKSLSGKSHNVISAVVIMYKDKENGMLANLYKF